MKARLLVQVGDYERFVIAKYWAPVAEESDKARTRATRAQVRRFVEAALKTAVKTQAVALTGRSRSAADRLKKPPGWQWAGLREQPGPTQLKLL